MVSILLTNPIHSVDVSVEGIFRKNGNIRHLKELSDEIDRNPSKVNLAAENPIQVAALLKKFLRDLPDSLLTSKLYKLFITSQSKQTSIITLLDRQISNSMGIKQNSKILSIEKKCYI